MIELSERCRIIAAAVAPVGEAAVREAEGICQLFAAELADYGEVIQSPPQQSAGLMIRGEGESFSERVRQIMQQWNMPQNGIAHHATLARVFEHQRAFFKMEWSRGDDLEHPRRLVAFYFRRRPSVDRVSALLEGCGVGATIVERYRRCARLLGKNSVHFVSAALRPDSAIHHKLYFSQWVTLDSAPAVAGRINRLLDEEGVEREYCRHWSMYHQLLAPAYRDETIFVSLNCTDDLVLPWVKIDYPQVAPTVAAGLLATADQAAQEQEMRSFANSMSLDELSYLGVRMHRHTQPTLKYYCDFPVPEPL